MAASRRITAGDGTGTFGDIRTLAALLVALALVSGCSGGDGEPEATTTTTLRVPEALDAFLDGVAPHGEVAFSATYTVLQKLGGESTEVKVNVDPPSWRIEAGDVVVTKDQTCVRGTCTDGVQENQLTQFGFTSRFFSSAPGRQLIVDANRSGAQPPVRSRRTVAGVDLDCIAVPVGQAAPTTACLTPEGVFGFVDDPARRVEVTSYTPR